MGLWFTMNIIMSSLVDMYIYQILLLPYWLLWYISMGYWKIGNNIEFHDHLNGDM